MSLLSSKRLLTCCAVLAAGMTLPTTALAQRDYFPALQNTKGEATHDVPLGPIGAVVRIKWGSGRPVVVELMKRGPGQRSGLDIGDEIVEVNGKKCPEYQRANSTGGYGPPEVIGNAILEAQASSQKELVFKVLKKDGKVVDLEIKLPKRSNFTTTFPHEDSFAREIIEASTERLMELQKDNGSFGNDYCTAFSGLALLASNDKKAARAAKQTARFLSDKYELRGKSPDRKTLQTDQGSNWMVCQVGIFLAEYHLATGDKSVLKAIQDCCDRMASRIDPPTGRYGHGGTNLPYEGKGLVIINTHAHLMWALAAHCGCKIDKEVWDLSMKCLDTATAGNHAIGYNFSARSGHQGGGRTGSLACALRIGNLQLPRLTDLGTWLGDHYKEFTDAHAMTSMGIIYGTFGLKATHYRKWEEHMRYHQWMFALSTPENWRQGSYYYGQKGNHGGDSYLGYQQVANFTNILLLTSYRDDTLWMLGNRKKEWLD
ncbi:hypothetical protein Rhal01_01895 [Rubritalea halochordaticola]|uniref:PDZ domain-containing protein n=1 Tax=Rubritalea halochordaticola TaxID=714537 RepID=A0ABP9UZ42_9BACT